MSNLNGKKLVTVFGATGKQGGSVVETILSHPELSKQFTIRGVTRDPSRPNALKLKERGVEVVSADISDLASLKTAVKGSYAVFAVTNFWEHCDKAKEIQDGKNLADAAKAEGVQHFIWSTLPSVSKLSKGKFTKVFHFDSKAEVAEYIRQLDLPHTFFQPGFYYNNLENFQKDHGALILSFPFPSSTKAPFLDASRDTGKFVAAILTHREKTLGKEIYGATAYYSFDEVLRLMEEKEPERKVLYIEGNEEGLRNALAGRPQHVIDDLYQMFLWIAEFRYFGIENAEQHVKSGIEILGLGEDERLRLTTLAEYVKSSEKL